MHLFSTPKKLEIFEQCTHEIAVYDSLVNFTLCINCKLKLKQVVEIRKEELDQSIISTQVTQHGCSAIVRCIARIY